MEEGLETIRLWCQIRRLWCVMNCNVGEIKSQMYYDVI